MNDKANVGKVFNLTSKGDGAATKAYVDEKVRELVSVPDAINSLNEKIGGIDSVLDLVNGEYADNQIMEIISILDTINGEVV